MSDKLHAEEKRMYDGSIANARELEALLHYNGLRVEKLEGGVTAAPTIKRLVDAGIPVMGHVGLLPQGARDASELRAQGRSAAEAGRIIDDARALEEAGCFSIVIEAVPAAVTEVMVAQLAVPTIGIGAGAAADGQVLVYHDLLGITEGAGAKFVKRYAAIRDETVAGIRQFAEEVRSRAYPGAEHTYRMAPEELAALRRHLGSS